MLELITESTIFIFSSVFISIQLNQIIISNKYITMAEIDYETGPETKELNIKLFDYFYIPDDLEDYEETLSTLESLILTKKDAENIFGQVFEFLGEEELDILKIKKSFLLAKKVLTNFTFGFKIFETVVGSNHSLFEEFIAKNEENLKEDPAAIEAYNELKTVIESYKQRAKDLLVAKPRMSVNVRKSVVKMEADLSELMKVVESEGNKNEGKRNSFINQNQRKSILEKFKAEYEKEIIKEEPVMEKVEEENEEEVKEKLNVNAPDDNKAVENEKFMDSHKIKPVQLIEEEEDIQPSKSAVNVTSNQRKSNLSTHDNNQPTQTIPMMTTSTAPLINPTINTTIIELPKKQDPIQLPQNANKRVSNTSGGLIDIDLSDIKKENENIRASIFQSQFENLMKINNIETFSNSPGKVIKTLSTKKLIEETNYKEEKDNEGENIFYNQSREVVLATLNLILKYIFQEKDQEKFHADLSKYFITQHLGIISSEHLLELLKSVLANSYSGVPSGFIKLLNNWIIHNYNEEIFSNQEIRWGVLKLYETVEKNHSEVNFNNKGKVRISELKEILKSEEREQTYDRIRKLAGLPVNNPENLGFHVEAPVLPLVQREYFDILDWSEVEIARQLTLVTSHLFNSIQSKELINSQWTRVDKLVHAPNVSKMIERFNKLSLWVCEEILAYDRGRYRAQAVDKFIKLAVELKNLNNFNDCFVIITALNSFQIKSLSKTWRRLSFETVKNFKELNNLCSYSGNYAALRAEIETCEGTACIPYLGYFLKELAFIEEGPKYIKDPNLVNIDKLRKVGKIIESIKSYQVYSYPFKPVFQLAFLSDTAPLTEEELTEISAKLEPKFTLGRSKNKLKRWTKTDLNIKILPSVFNNFIQSLNKEKNTLSLKERIKMHFKK